MLFAKACCRRQDHVARRGRPLQSVFAAPWSRKNPRCGPARAPPTRQEPRVDRLRNANAAAPTLGSSAPSRCAAHTQGGPQWTTSHQSTDTTASRARTKRTRTTGNNLRNLARMTSNRPSPGTPATVPGAKHHRTSRPAEDRQPGPGLESGSPPIGRSQPTDPAQKERAHQSAPFPGQARCIDWRPHGDSNPGVHRERVVS